ncbi:MAG: type II 3-dehydroquinate dehydratase [Gammaproteobacteria bacterium]|jgi:3-dehydroquinate dehydratase-2|nr:type II 3-dehydroquinate dehydratase [Gammaproteobacteria bacterium]HJM08492.1 type II 3-dehydroquinate dehydratase [Gammaproteobacteria bacterium]|tara:strand:- start:7020 stop:7457 length:438 start_codon:yes stop_codon:yes gene_type:complete
MSNLLLINGPNLNLLGSREPGIYGSKSLDDIEKELSIIAENNGHKLHCFQSNSESDIVDWIHEHTNDADFLIINPGAFTHTSISIRDAILGTDISFIEIHISNIFSREEFRKESYFSDIAEGVISGLGFKGYELALNAALGMLKK